MGITGMQLLVRTREFLIKMLHLLPGEGPVGLITYMRTDSVRVSDVALAQVRDFIGKTWGGRYLPEKPNF